MSNLKKIMTVFLICLSVVNCSKKKGSSAVATAPTVTGYDIKEDGLCYDSNNVQVNMTLCTDGNTGDYGYNKYGQCCDGNGNEVGSSFCDPNSVVCSGEYVGSYQKKMYDIWGFFTGYKETWYYVTCDGQAGGNCSDFYLMRWSDKKYYNCK